jgi:hypothetical protein
MNPGVSSIEGEPKAWNLNYGAGRVVLGHLFSKNKTPNTVLDWIFEVEEIDSLSP